jgi:hypothetical protein
MTVYVDRLRAVQRQPGPVFPYAASCHLTADSEDELVAFGKKLRLRREWLHTSRNGTKHFDLTPGKRAKAVALGATER